VRAGSLLPTRTLRLDVHPADLGHPRHMLALEWVLGRRGERRRAVTYRELAGLASSAGRICSSAGFGAQFLDAVNIDASNGVTADRPA
jgi:hypothetical protein